MSLADNRRDKAKGAGKPKAAANGKAYKRVEEFGQSPSGLARVGEEKSTHPAIFSVRSGSLLLCRVSKVSRDGSLQSPLGRDIEESDTR